MKIVTAILAWILGLLVVLLALGSFGGETTRAMIALSLGVVILAVGTPRVQKPIRSLEKASLRTIIIFVGFFTAMIVVGTGTPAPTPGNQLTSKARDTRAFDENREAIIDSARTLMESGMAGRALHLTDRYLSSGDAQIREINQAARAQVNAFVQQETDRIAAEQRAKAEKKRAAEQAAAQKRAAARAKQSKRSDQLDASVSFSGTQFTITNNDSYDWTNVKMEVNGGLVRGGYVLKTNVIRAGQTYTVGAMQFAKGDGERFNPFTHKVQQFHINSIQGYWFGEMN